MQPTTFQYIPIRDYLTVFFSNVNVRDLYFSETPSTDGFLRSHRDGLHFKNSILYSRNRFALRLQLFGDEVEVTNPLGSKVKQHELLNVYGRILNLPPHVNSTLKSIFCVAVVNSSYLNTKDVYDVVLGHIVEELMQLSLRNWTLDSCLCIFVFRVEPGVYFVGVCCFGFIDPSLVNPTLIDRPAVSFEDLIRYMIDEVIVLDESCFFETDL
jgi:hypothetical protein